MRQMRAKNIRKFDLCKKFCNFRTVRKIRDSRKIREDLLLAKNTLPRETCEKFANFDICRICTNIRDARKKIRNCTKRTKICKYLLSTQICTIHEKYSLLKLICPARISNTKGLIILYFNVMSCQN
jgi:hypothetical protein